MVTQDRITYRKEALLWSIQPENLDDLLRVTGPNEQIFRVALLVLVFGLTAGGVLALM